MSDEEWVKAAMTDESMVVELLFKLNQSTPSPPKTALLLEWSVRQRRSRSVMTLHNPKKQRPVRASPTTPLSWSAATSLSGAGGCAIDGFEESSRPPPKRTNATRSKVTGIRETTTTKRVRKKKTLAELKEEEIMLLKERRHLKKELATLRISLEKQRTTNESLKRMKLDLQSQPVAERIMTVASDALVSGQSQQRLSATDCVPQILSSNIASNDCQDSRRQFSPWTCYSTEQEGIADIKNNLAVPDLNLPFEDDRGTEVLRGISY